jgi:hypothetical protein
MHRAHETAKHLDLLSGYRVHLTPNLKPDMDQMADIVKCSGGDAVNFDPCISPGDKVIIVSCEQDLGICRAAIDEGVPIYSTELILGGVLRQELDLESYPDMQSDCALWVVGISPPPPPSCVVIMPALFLYLY